VLKLAENCAYWQRKVSFSFGTKVDASFRVGKKEYLLGRMTVDQWAKFREWKKFPRRILTVRPRQYWDFEGSFYWDDEGLMAEDVNALLLTRRRANRERAERAKATVTRGFDNDKPSRKQASAEVQQFVFVRDGGQCLECGSKQELQFDHIIPVALGGSSEPENLQILCGPCNRKKGAGFGTFE
jgi:hypothetical protein